MEHEVTIDREVVDFCQGTDLLIQDGQYTDEELHNHRSWGHSSFSQAIEVAALSNAKQLIITHHDPDHNSGNRGKMPREISKLLPGKGRDEGWQNKKAGFLS